MVISPRSQAAELPAGPQWQVVEQALEKGLLQTAISELQPIIERTQREGATAEAIHAVCLKIALEAEIQGNQPEERIRRMETAIEGAAEPMRPVMQSILAHWYWQYYQQNRWRYLQRTEESAASTDDLTSWSLPRILEEIDQHFQRALADTETLRSIPIEDYDALLVEGTAPADYRPTLYDFLAHDAIEFYAAGEQAGARPQGAWDLQAASPVFGDVPEFLAWDPNTDEEETPLLKAVRLYQALLRFHQEDADPAARLDANLARLRFAHNTAVGETNEARYRAALQRYEQDAADHPISTRALYEWALLHWEQEKFVEAHEVAQRAIARFPESLGAKSCRELVEQIESPQLVVQTERVWNRAEQAPPQLDVEYKNIRQVHFRLVPFDFQNVIGSAVPDVERFPHQPGRLQRLLRQQPLRSWTADLPATEDFQVRSESLTVPEDLSPGGYVLLASSDGAFQADNNTIAVHTVWVSDLAMLVRSDHNRSRVEVLVLENETGRPIAGAEVQVYAHERTRNENRNRLISQGQTDADGLFGIENEPSTRLLFYVRHDDQVLASTSLWHSGRQDNRTQASEQTQFFTDRSLYRPGQTIQYKGVCLSADTSQSRYQTLAGRELTVVFVDANGQEIERRQHRTNDYGSFSGSVVAPQDRLTGQMFLRVEGQPSGQTAVNVEAYKRPKFRVTLDPPDEAPRLNEQVAVSGNASAYTGVAIGNAQVRWRVVREVRFPIWWQWRFWGMPPHQQESQEIANGETQTAADGSFDLQFVAQPDPEVERSSEPTFRFTVYADVTDASGETRTADKTITIGYTALQARLNAKQSAEAESATATRPVDPPSPGETSDTFLTDEEEIVITVHTETLDGQGKSTSGQLKIYRLQQPERVHRDPLGGSGRFPTPFEITADEPSPDSSDPNRWPLGEMVAERPIETDGAGKATEPFSLSVGYYRAKWESRDSQGNLVTAVLPLRVLDPDAEQLDLKVPQLVALRQTSVEPGETFEFLWGSGYEEARAFIEIAHQGETLRQFWTEPGKTQRLVQVPVQESMRGGFTIRVSMVRENRSYLFSRRIEVPWTNKQLDIRWERFTSKLQPGAQERWTAVISGPDAEQAAAEMVAALYDASLDAFLPHNWIDRFQVFRQDHDSLQSHFANQAQALHVLSPSYLNADRWRITYRQYPPRIVQPSGISQRRGGMMMFGAMGGGMGARVGDDMMEMSAAAPANAAMEGAPVSKQQGEQSAAPDLSNVAPRTNLAETAFFFPHLTAGQDGTVQMDFTMPEALTEWRFLGFAHDKDLRSGSLTDTTVTAKDLMVEPNPPRFVRTGDRLEMTVKVSNQSPTQQAGTVRLSFQDARTRNEVDDRLGNSDGDRSFQLAAGESKVLSWKVSIPDDLTVLIYKAVGSTGRLSDGEEGYLPVLSKKVLVTESLQLPIRGPQVKTFAFPRFQELADSPSVEHHALTVEMSSNPAWYAVLALPYLMEYPYECSEQVFNRLYANALGREIVTANPAAERIFRQWREMPAATDPLTSPLAKNEDLKSVLLEETPWVREANDESQARRNVGILFDDNRLNAETEATLQQLSQMQRSDGAWPWFPGGPSNRFITLYITAGFGRLEHLGTQIDTTAARRALPYLDRWMEEEYDDIQSADRDESHLSPTVALYLYTRSFFIDRVPVDAKYQAAFEYWVQQAQRHWLQLNSRMSQAHLAVALHRLGDQQTPLQIMASLKERSVSDEELGRYWRDTEQSWWWYRADIETQAMMIEALDEVSNDAEMVQQCKVWLLKQKQTQAWKSTKATADAVYALLLRGDELLQETVPVEVSLGDRQIEPTNTEAGTGYFRERLEGDQVEPTMGQITVRKQNEGIAWGGLHWQYFQEIDQITPRDGTPLQVEKDLFVRKNTSEGPKLFPIDGPLNVGDELVVQLMVRTDRAMEYVHLKDQRGSGTEPENVLSGYRYQDGLAYYESTRDSASHFFIDNLPKGTYVLEYDSRVQLRGEYASGIATLECMYAPEFNSHSVSVTLDVQ